MEFSEYEKMAADFSKFEANKKFAKQKWLVTEKIHGANFSFHTNGVDVRVARRRDLLNSEENFFNHKNAEFMKTYPEKMKGVYCSVAKLLKDEEILQISIYGELFGGKYIVNGKDLNTNGNNPIQSEIQYSPNIEWSAFDISYRLKSTPSTNEYLDPEESMKIFEEHGIFYLKPLFIGSMCEALNYELGFDSTIPKMFGLPPLEKGTNKAEGIVVKPITNLKGIYRGEECRVIVKLKIPEFMEQTPAPKKDRMVNNAKVKEASLLQKVMNYATEQRLANAISKIGDPSHVVQENIIEEFISDIFNDIKEYDEDLHKTWANSTDQNKIRNVIRKKATGLLNKFKTSN